MKLVARTAALSPGTAATRLLLSLVALALLSVSPALAEDTCASSCYKPSQSACCDVAKATKEKACTAIDSNNNKIEWKCPWKPIDNPTISTVVDGHPGHKLKMTTGTEICKYQEPQCKKSPSRFYCSYGAEVSDSCDISQPTGDSCHGDG